jgi:hypothetical protein
MPQTVIRIVLPDPEDTNTTASVIAERGDLAAMKQEAYDNLADLMLTVQSALERLVQLEAKPPVIPKLTQKDDYTPHRMYRGYKQKGFEETEWDTDWGYPEYVPPQKPALVKLMQPIPSVPQLKVKPATDTVKDGKPLQKALF